jgi:phage terminase large subunit-like protein
LGWAPLKLEDILPPDVIELRKFYWSMTPDQQAIWRKALTPKQRDMLRKYPEVLAFDKQLIFGRQRYTFLRCGRSFGKMLDLDTELPTPTGFTRLRDLQVGDTLFDENGQPCCVTELHPIDLRPESYRLTFNDGTTVDACGDHLWLTFTKANRKSAQRAANPSNPTVKTTREIYETQRAGTKHEANHSVPCSKPINYPKKDLPIDPYTLGVWLGDGSTNSGTLECADQEILDALLIRGYTPYLLPSSVNDSKSCAYRLGALLDYQLENGTPHKIGLLTWQLKQEGLLYNKHIPEAYLYASFEQRLELLQGLLDTDGCCDKRGVIEYCTILPKLAEQVCQLIRSLGIKANIHRHESWLYDKRCSDRYRIWFLTDMPVFKLTRKLANLRPHTQTHRYITSVERIASKPMRCITVDSPSHLFLVTRSFIPTHNSWAGGCWIARKLLSGATELGLCGETHAKVVKVMIPAIQYFVPDLKFNKQLNVATTGNATIYCFTSENETRGNNLEYLWNDELGSWCDNVSEKIETRYNILNYCVRVGMNPQTLNTTTPKPFPLFRKWQKRFESGDINYKIFTGTMLDNPSISDDVKQLMKAEAELDRWGRQEFWGDLLDAVDNAYWTEQNLIDNRVSPDPTKLHINLPFGIDLRYIVIAVDPAGSSNSGADETGIMVCGRGTDGHGYVLHDASGKYAPLEWAKKVNELYLTYSANWVVAEKNFGGDMVEANLRQANPFLPIKMTVSSKAKTIRAEPIATLYAKHQIHHVGVFPDLEAQMVIFNGQASTKTRKDDRLDALVFALSELFPPAQPVYRDFSNLPNLNLY